MREDLSPIEWSVLRALARSSRPTRAIELCITTRLDQGAMAVYLQRLATRRLVSSTGRRTLRLWRLTGAGRAAIDPVVRTEATQA